MKLLDIAVREKQPNSLPDWYQDLGKDFDYYLLNEFIPKYYPETFYVTENIYAYYQGQVFSYDTSYDLDKMSRLEDDEKYKVYFTYLKYRNYSNLWGDYTYDILKTNYERFCLIRFARDNQNMNKLLSFAEELGVNKLQLEDYGDKYIYDIVGVYHPEYVNSYIAIANLPVIVNDNLYNKLKDENKGYYMSLIAPMPYNVSDIEKLLRFNFSGIKNGVHYSLSNEAMSVWVYIQNYYLEMLFYSLLYHGYLVGSIALALYIRLLYIGSKYKRKEIEILRNMGASKADRLAIMIGENCVLALILYAVSLLITFIGTIGLNLYIQRKYLIRLSLFAFGLKEVLVLFALTALFFVITSLKSIIFISRKKPFIK